MRYVIETRGGEKLSGHRTRQGALDAWRVRHAGRPVRIVRVTATGDRILVVEGTWHADTGGRV